MQLMVAFCSWFEYERASRRTSWPTLSHLQPREELATLRAVHAHLPRHRFEGGVVAGEGGAEIPIYPPLRLERPLEPVGHRRRVRPI